MAPLVRLAAVLQAFSVVTPAAARRADHTGGGAAGFPVRGLAAAGAAVSQRFQPGEVALHAAGPSPSLANAFSQALQAWSVMHDDVVDTSSPLEVDQRAAAEKAAAGERAELEAFLKATSRGDGQNDHDEAEALATRRLFNLPEEWANNIEGLELIVTRENTALAKGRLTHDPSVGVVLKLVVPRTEEQVDALCNELHYLMLMRGTPAVVTLHRQARSADIRMGTEVLLLFERADGNLRELVLRKSFEEVPLRTRIRLFADIVRGMEDMLENGCAHGDLTPENILVFMGDCDGLRPCHAAVADFGNATRVAFTSVPATQATMEALGKILFKLITIPDHGRAPPKTPEDVRPALEGILVGEEHGMQLSISGFVTLLELILDKRERPSCQRVLDMTIDLAKRSGIDTTPRDRVEKLHAWQPLPTAVPFSQRSLNSK